MPDAPPSPAGTTSRLIVRRVGFAVGALLLAAAILGVARSSDAMGTLREAMARTSVGRLALVAIYPAISWLLTGAIFYSLTRVRARVGRGEMLALIGSSWLLNYLPLSAGLLGRVAYHRAVNGIPVRTSARVVAESVACSLLGGAVFLADQILTDRARTTMSSLLGMALLPVVLFVTILGMRLARSLYPGAIAASVLLKYLDTCLWSLRYAMLFDFLGVQISMREAAAIALVAQSSMLVPGIGNALGLREWTVALLGSALPIAFATNGFTRGTGLSADLLNRAIELAVAIPVGLLSALYLSARIRRLESVRSDSSKPPHHPTS